MLHKKKNRTDCSNYRGISLVTYAGQVLFRIVAPRLSNYGEAEGIPPQEQCGFRPAQSTVDTLFVVRRLQNLGRQRKFPRTCASSICKKRTTLPTESCCGTYSQALAKTRMFSFIHDFHKDLWARVGTNDGEHSEWFYATQGCSKAACYNRCCPTCSSMLRYTSYWYASAKTKPS